MGLPFGEEEPRVPCIHILKTIETYFDKVYRGKKNFEIRKDDRSPRFEVDDYLLLREVSKVDEDNLVLTGRETVVKVTYVLRGSKAKTFGLQEGYCVMSVQPFIERLRAHIAYLVCENGEFSAKLCSMQKDFIKYLEGQIH